MKIISATPFSDVQSVYRLSTSVISSSSYRQKHCNVSEKNTTDLIRSFRHEDFDFIHCYRKCDKSQKKAFFNAAVMRLVYVTVDALGGTV